MPDDSSLRGDGAVADASSDAQVPPWAECGARLQHSHPDCRPEPAFCDGGRFWQTANQGSCIDYACQPRLNRARECFDGCDTDGCRLCPGDDPLTTLPNSADRLLERRCFSLDDMLDGSSYPYVATDLELGLSPARDCPPSDVLAWEPIGESCAYREGCPGALTPTETEAGECCYVVFWLCGV